MKILKYRLMEANPGMDGSTSSPSTQTSSATPSSEAAAPAEAFDFAALVSDGGDSGENAAPLAPTVTVQPSAAPPSGAAVPTTVVAPPASPQAPPVAQAVPAAPVPGAAAPVPAAPAAPNGQVQNQPSAPAPAAPSDQNQPQQLTPELVAQRFAQHRDKFLPQLQQLYQVPEAEVEELRTAPETALPKLAARMHYEVQIATFQSVMQALPEFIAPLLEQRANTERLANDFKTMWPTLHEKPEYMTAAEQSIRAVRSANPKLAPAEVMRQAGMLALMTLGLPLPALQQSGAPAAPAAPVASAVPVGRTPPMARPPGIAGSAPNPLAVPGVQAEENIFTQMAIDHAAGN